MMRSQAYNDLLCSSCFPSLLESPCNMTAENDQETRSSERQSNTSADDYDVSCHSISMEPNTYLTVHHIHQIQCGSRSDCPHSSDQLFEMDGAMESSYMHNLMLNGPRIYVNKMSRSEHFSAPSVRCNQICAILDRQPGIQQLRVLEKSPHLYRIRNFHLGDPTYWLVTFTKTCELWCNGKPPHGIRACTQVQFSQVSYLAKFTI